MSSICEAVVDTTHRQEIGKSSVRSNTFENNEQGEALFDHDVHENTGTSGIEGGPVLKVPLSLFHQETASAVEKSQLFMTSTETDDDLKETANMLEGVIADPTCTSTPVSGQRTYSACGFNVSKDQVRFSDSCKEGDDSRDETTDSQNNETPIVVPSVSVVSSGHQADMVDPSDISVPIRGYEIMEQRARFTVFKIQVFRTSHDSWYVFRRYTDFVQLNDKLVVLFPGFRLALPSKKWFGDNFDPNFLEDRQLGLQAFINNITGHKDICNSKPCRDFFCFDDPPGPHDSLEESRALCEALEEQLYNTKKILEERDVELMRVTEERDLYKAQVESLQTSLRIQRTLNKKSGEVLISPQKSDGSLAECDQPLATEDNKHRTQITEECRPGDRSPESGIGEGTVTTPTDDVTQ